MSQPRLLDAYCGAGGATKGYQRAGFHVTGIDHVPQPNYSPMSARRPSCHCRWAWRPGLAIHRGATPDTKRQESRHGN